MNILVLNSAKEWGGTEKWALHTAIGLAAKGHTVYFGCRGALFDGRFAGSAVATVKFPFANNADIVTVARLRSFIRKNRIDAVMPSKQREYFLAGIAAKLATRAKVAGMFGIDRPIHNLRNWIAFHFLFDRVFVVAKKIIDVLAATKNFDTGKCRVVYVGVQRIERSENLRKKCRAELGVAENEFCIMGIGRLAPQKGFDLALEALSLLVKYHARAKLVIAGSGDIVPLAALAARLGVAAKAIFTGFRDDIPQLVQAADTFWLTSRSEGIPNTMLEAMAAGIPVVAFDIAGVAEVIHHEKNGILVRFGDVGELAHATAMLIDDPARRRTMGEQGLRRVTNDFSMEKMCADTEAHLQELLGGRKD